MGKKDISNLVLQFAQIYLHHFWTTVDSRYLEIEGNLKNTLRYPYFDISDL